MTQLIISLLIAVAIVLAIWFELSWYPAWPPWPIPSKETRFRVNPIKEFRIARKQRKEKHPDCVEPGNCSPQGRPHWPCVDCGGLTCSRSMRIDPKTLRRLLMPVCFGCADWREVTDPIINGSLRVGEMPEQLPGPTRMALRAFYESTDTRAVVEDVGAETLNQSIASLGLSGSMYAETRGGETVLRKVQPKAKAARS